MMRQWRAWRSREPRAHRTLKQRVLAVLGGLVVAYALYLIAAPFIQRAAYFPARFMTPPAGEVPRGVEVLWHEIEGGGRVEAWLRVPETASAQSPAPLAIYLHGNAEFIDDSAWIADIYNRKGYAVLLPEFRGYGRSAGSPSEEGVAHDVEAFLAMVGSRPEIDGKRLVVHGRSIGAGVSAGIIEKHAPDGVVLQSAFTSMTAMLLRYGVPPFLARDPMRVDHAIERFDGPVLIMHGTSDEIIPFTHALKLRSLARDATFLEGTGGHNDLPGTMGEYRDAIEGFLARLNGADVHE